MGRLLLFGIPISLGLLLGVMFPCLAETVPVTLSGDEVHYDYELKQIEASGNVRIKYKDINIQCERVLIDQKENILLATGRVLLDQKGDLYNGDRFLYYLQREQGWLEPLTIEINPDNDQVRDKVFITAGEGFVKGEEVRLKQAFFTSCNLSEPHFHLTAKEIEYFPDNRIVFRRVWYWERNLKLFYLPYLVVPLKEKENNFEVQIGETPDEGLYLYVGYNYFLSDTSYGKVNFKTTEYGGDSIGVKHTFENSAVSKWWQEFDILDKSDQGIPDLEYKYGFGYENSLNPQLKITTDLENWHRYTEWGNNYLETTYNFNYLGSGSYPKLYLHFEDEDEDIDRTIDLGGNWRYKPDPTLEFLLGGRWYLTDTLTDVSEAEEQFGYNLTALKDWRWSNAKLYISNTKILSGNMSSYNYNPEFTYTIPSWKWPLLGTVKAAAQYTNLDKYPADDRGERLAIDIQNTPNELWSNQEHTLTLNTSGTIQYRRLDFVEDDTDNFNELTSLSGNLGLTNYFTKSLTTTLKLSFTGIDGETINDDFFCKSDSSILSGASISNDWRYKSPKWEASLGTGYNFNSEYAFPVNMYLNWFIDSKSHLNFSSIYYWDQGLGQNNLNLFYNPKDKWRLSLYLGYDFLDSDNPWLRREFEASVEDRLVGNWRFQLAARYDPYDYGFSVGELNLIYDWHCRELVFHFDWVEKQFWFQVNIKAIRQAQFRMGINPMEYIQDESF